MQNYDDLAAMSNQDAYQNTRLELNEVSLNGDKGLYRKRVYLGRASRDEKPEEVELGRDIEVVFLKIRRKLVERGNKGEIIRSTNEHNTPKDTVRLYDADSKDRVHNSAASVREQFPGLRTVQVVYALLLGTDAKPELVRLNIKGASLGSEAKPEGVMSFYQYLASFGDEHFFQFKTKLSTIQEEGAKTYFAMTFDRGDALNDGQMGLVADTMRKVHDATSKQDAFYLKEKETPEPAEEVAEDDATEDEDEIPF